MVLVNFENGTVDERYVFQPVYLYWLYNFKGITEYKQELTQQEFNDYGKFAGSLSQSFIILLLSALLLKSAILN